MPCYRIDPVALLVSSRRRSDIFDVRGTTRERGLELHHRRCIRSGPTVRHREKPRPVDPNKPGPSTREGIPTEYRRLSPCFWSGRVRNHLPCECQPQLREASGPPQENKSRV